MVIVDKPRSNQTHTTHIFNRKCSRKKPTDFYPDVFLTLPLLHYQRSKTPESHTNYGLPSIELRIGSDRNSMAIR